MDLNNGACQRYYVLGNCLYEREYEEGSDSFSLMHGLVEQSYSEEQLVEMGAIKYLYGVYPDWLNHWPIGEQRDWKFGLVTRDVYRASDDKFEINDTSDGWVSTEVDKATLHALYIGTKSLLDLDWQ